MSYYNAAIDAGYSPHTAANARVEILEKPRVAQAFTEILKSQGVDDQAIAGAVSILLKGGVGQMITHRFPIDVTEEQVRAMFAAMPYVKILAVLELKDDKGRYRRAYISYPDNIALHKGAELAAKLAGRLSDKPDVAIQVNVNPAAELAAALKSS